MDAIRIIKHDHRKVESMFEQFETLIGLPGEGRTRLIEEICQELVIHTTLEEELLYPDARRVLDAEVVDHAEREHDEAERLIARIRACDPSSTEAEGLMLELKQSVTHHVEEEESNFLPRMEDACGTDVLESLGTRIEDRKEHLEAKGDDGASSSPLLDLTKEELYDKAQQANIPGRSKMTKSELADALSGKR